VCHGCCSDHIPVKADLSDLADVIAWCKTHDLQCQEIVHNAEKLYDRLINTEGQLDYMQLMTYHIAKRCGLFMARRDVLVVARQPALARYPFWM
jgi:hypothetical protein